MHRYIVPTLVALFAAAPAYAASVPGICDNGNRAAADEQACACVTEAAAAVQANGGVRAGADYSAWQNDIFYPSSATSPTVSAPVVNNIIGSCFDMLGIVDTATGNFRSRHLHLYADVAGNHADGFPVTATTEFDFTVSLKNPIWYPSGTRFDRVDTQFGDWAATTSTSGPVLDPLPDINLVVLDPFTVRMEDATGSDMGTLHTQGQPVAGALLSYNSQGQIEADVFFFDGTQATVDGLGIGTQHFM